MGTIVLFLNFSVTIWNKILWNQYLCVVLFVYGLKVQTFKTFNSQYYTSFA